jgi:ketosteroid isomerase-like protein
MSRRTTAGPAVLVSLIVLTLTMQPAYGSTAGEEAAVGAANDAFYAALNAMFTGAVAPMEEVWSHAEDVTYMGPDGGLKVGWDQVLPVWKEQAAAMLGGEVRPEGTRMTVGRDLAVIQTVERGANVDSQGNPLAVSIRATNVFRKEGGKWKMIGHHTDLLPFLEQ